MVGGKGGSSGATINDGKWLHIAADDQADDRATLYSKTKGISIHYN
jgi:hypothetical protein